MGGQLAVSAGEVKRICLQQRQSLQVDAKVPMNPGPLRKLLQKLAKVRESFKKPHGVSKIRIGLVTVWNAPAHARVIQSKIAR